MNTLFHLVCLAILASLSSLPDALTVFIWLLTYGQPFAVEYFKHRLKRQQ